MRRLGLSFAQLATATLAGQVIGFAILALVARRIGPSYLGAYAFASNFIPYITLPLSGLVMLSVRDVAQNRATASSISGAVLPILACYAVIACGLVFAFASDIAPTHTGAMMLRILVLAALVGSVTLDWLLQGLQAVNAVALMRLLGQVCFGLAGWLLITSGKQGAYRYCWITVLGLFVTFLGISIYAVRSTGWPKLRFSPHASMTLLKRSGPFIVSLVMIQLYYSADFVLLGFLSHSAALGQYLVAYRIPLAFLGLASLWIWIFYPHAATQTWPTLRRQIGSFTTLSLILVIPLCAGSLLVAEPLMTTLFGSQYRPAGLYFGLLMLAVGFAAVDANVGQILLATGRERTFALGVSVGALLNLSLNLLLIPSLGPEGSAIATVAAEAAVLVFMAIRLSAMIGPPRLAWARIAGAFASTLVMVLSLSFLASSWPVSLQIAAGVSVYCLAALATRTLRTSDYRRFMRTSRHAVIHDAHSEGATTTELDLGHVDESVTH